MRAITFLSTAAILALLARPVLAAEVAALRGRVDTGLKLGTERSLLGTEFWVPLSQGRDRVLYTDLRLTGDDQDNFEGNLGFGYRQIVGNSVLGAHGWIDRRHTESGATFHQATVGLEALGRDLDARANAYLPLSDGKTYGSTGTAHGGPYLASSGVFFDTAGFLREVPLGGFDLELGLRVPAFTARVDSIRVYGGGYHFSGEDVEDVTGFRARISADVTPWFALGARFQKDAERGSQGFLEATFRLPGKASFRTSGLRARLDESPERDIDIVTGTAETPGQTRQPVLNADSGAAQRVIHVDNSAAGGGDGSLDTPYNTLAAAEGAMLPYDVIYVHAGDGTTAGQDLGITIDEPGVSLIGSGVNLVYAGGRVTGATSGGSILASATAAPVITNNQVNGDGVYVTDDSTFLSGFTVDGAQQYGVYANSAAGTWENLSIESVTVRNNASHGIYALAQNGGQIDAVTLDGITATGNTGRGVFAQALNGGQIGTATLDGITAQNNSVHGVLVQALNGGIGTATLDGITATGNASQGVIVHVRDTGQISTLTLDDVIATANTGGDGHGIQIYAEDAGAVIQATVSRVTAQNNALDGLLVYARAGGQIGTLGLDDVTATGNNRAVVISAEGASSIGTLTLDEVTATGNASGGVYVAAADAGSAITTANITGITSTGNGSQGVLAETTSGGQIGIATFDGITATGNVGFGVRLFGQTNGILSASLEHVTATGNTSNGVYVDDDTAGAFTVDLGGGSLGSTGGNRIYGNTGTDLRVDLDGGELKAENNWWGNAAGLLPARVTLDAGSTVDSAPFLAADPGP